MEHRKTIIEYILEWLTNHGIKLFRDIIKKIDTIPAPINVMGISQRLPIQKIRITMVDGSFLDIYWNDKGKYSLHYDRTKIDGTFYRYDNAPHAKYRNIKTFPHHFHVRVKNREEVTISDLPHEPIEALEYFLRKIRELIKQGEGSP